MADGKIDPAVMQAVFVRAWVVMVRREWGRDGEVRWREDLFHHRGHGGAQRGEEVIFW